MAKSTQREDNSPGSEVLAALVAEDVIDVFAAEELEAEARAGGTAVEELLLARSILTEAALLARLSARYRTHFVSTHKLAGARIDPALLDRFPRTLAVRLGVIPVLFDERARTLSLIAADPSRADLEAEARRVLGATKVTVYVARARTIDAAIDKHYLGRPERMQALVAATAASSPVRPGRAPSDVEPVAIDVGFSTSDLVESLAHLATPTPARQVSELPSARSPTEHGAVSSEAYLETLQVFAALLERLDPSRRGHSAKVARLTRLVAARVGVEAAERTGIVAAALLHDVGKPPGEHPSPLSVAHAEPARQAAKASYLAPVRLFEAAGLPPGAATALTHLYERWDGHGFPGRLSGREVPLGARILSVAETFVDLTTTDTHPFRRRLTSAEACQALARASEKVFDPTLVEVLRNIVVGADPDGEKLDGRGTVLLVDPDPDETIALEMRLSGQGYDVIVARDAAEAVAHVSGRGVDLVISEIDLPGADGFALLERIGGAQGAAPLVLFVARRGDRETVRRALSRGAADFVVKPASAELVALRARLVLSRRQVAAAPRGVTGALEEMSLPDLVQILASGRKSGKLTLESGGRHGELHFGSGAIYDAIYEDARGANAFYAMLRLVEGSFALDPSFVPDADLIGQSTEGLLLEGMRRLDEDAR